MITDAKSGSLHCPPFTAPWGRGTGRVTARFDVDAQGFVHGKVKLNEQRRNRGSEARERRRMKAAHRRYRKHHRGVSFKQFLSMKEAVAA